MKKLYDVINEVTEKVDNLPTIYCDMDMVLCDFIGGSEEVLGVPFPKADKRLRWSKITAKKDFWDTLEWMPGARKLWSFVDKYESHILSAYSTKDANSRKGKMNWLKRNARLTKKSRIHLVLREDKKKFAMINGEPNLLIDDYIKNVNEWKAAGGMAIHHISPTSTIAELKRLGFK